VSEREGSVKRPVEVMCTRCHGTGFEDQGPFSPKCIRCGGSGDLWKMPNGQLRRWGKQVMKALGIEVIE